MHPWRPTCPTATHSTYRPCKPCHVSHTSHMSHSTRICTCLNRPHDVGKCMVNHRCGKGMSRPGSLLCPSSIGCLLVMLPATDLCRVVQQYSAVFSSIRQYSILFTAPQQYSTVLNSTRQCSTNHHLMRRWAQHGGRQILHHVLRAASCVATVAVQFCIHDMIRGRVH